MLEVHVCRNVESFVFSQEMLPAERFLRASTFDAHTGFPDRRCSSTEWSMFLLGHRERYPQLFSRSLAFQSNSVVSGRRVVDQALGLRMHS